MEARRREGGGASSREASNGGCVPSGRALRGARTMRNMAGKGTVWAPRAASMAGSGKAALRGVGAGGPGRVWLSPGQSLSLWRQRSLRARRPSWRRTGPWLRPRGQHRGAGAQLGRGGAGGKGGDGWAEARPAARPKRAVAAGAGVRTAARRCRNPGVQRCMLSGRMKGFRVSWLRAGGAIGAQLMHSHRGNAHRARALWAAPCRKAAGSECCIVKVVLNVSHLMYCELHWQESAF
jgi:hypothetical protein